MDSDSEPKLISLISELVYLPDFEDSEWESTTMSMIIDIISLVRSMDLDSQPKPKSKLMSLVTQTVSVFNSMDLDSLPKPLSKLISLISQRISKDSDQKPESDLSFKSLVEETLRLKQGHEIISLIRQIVSTKNPKRISLCPKVIGTLWDGNFQVARDFEGNLDRFWTCFIGDWSEPFSNYFWCTVCNGEYHKEYEQAPLEIKHPLHQKHSLQLVFSYMSSLKTRECYCCEEDLKKVYYYCSSCDYVMNITCAEKAPPLSIPNPKWHEHTLSLFPRKTSLTCDVCALAHSNSPFYICPPCDFVVHLKCMNLPRVLRISRHPHRMRYTPSFDEGNWSCSVCRRKIDNDYGGYSCIKDGCSYAAHSRCATQSNVWDGIDLEGEPEEIEEEVIEPFVRISDGIIQHFSHEHHHLRLDENTSRDYDDNMLCQACITPIYFGNFYSCLQCEFVLHETCANLSRKMYHPVHPHMLTLALKGGNATLVTGSNCLVCERVVTVGFIYECGKEDCHFRLHVQCASISEPLVSGSHLHPLFLTSKPGEKRYCSVCGNVWSEETFNCIECDNFAMCFACAALPQKVRYKHDKHILTLSYGQEETSTVTYWCEACERKIKPKKRFYMCDEYCCVTLHIKCLIGKDLYMMPGSSFSFFKEVNVLSNNQHMTRPICSKCKKRCPQKIVCECSGSILCSLQCANFF